MRRLALLAVALAPAAAGATEPAPAAFRRGVGELGLFADASIASELTLVSVGLRGGYFVRAGLELGGELQATLLVAPPRVAAAQVRADEPGAGFRVTPFLRWMPLRTDGFAAYLMAGVGPGAIGREVLGHVLAAPGAMVALGGRVWLDLAFRFTIGFPGARCRAAFAADSAPGFCELQFGPQLGLLAAF